MQTVNYLEFQQLQEEIHTLKTRFAVETGNMNDMRTIALNTEDDSDGDGNAKAKNIPVGTEAAIKSDQSVKCKEAALELLTRENNRLRRAKYMEGLSNLFPIPAVQTVYIQSPMKIRKWLKELPNVKLVSI